VTKTLMTLTVFFIFFGTYGLYLSQYEPMVINEDVFLKHSLEFFDYKGVLNIHTDMSIGSEPISKVVIAAKEVGLDFILLTDLNQFHNFENFETYFDHTLVLNGGKFSYLDSRLNYYSLEPKKIGSALGEAQIFFSDALSKQRDEEDRGLIWLAHPFKAGYDWTGEMPAGLDGAEILNLKSLSNQAIRSSKFSVLWSLMIYPFNPKLALVRLFEEPSEEINLFDTTSQKRPFIAFAGAEASARAIPFADFLVKFPSYQRLFSSVTTHVVLRSELTGQISSDREKIFSALKAGQSYLALELLGNPKGFLATVKDGRRSHLMGEKIKFRKNLRLDVELPGEPNSFFEVALYRNGLRVETANTVQSSFAINEPGVYRVQVRVSPQLPLPDAKKWLTWIYTNNFYIQ